MIRGEAAYVLIDERVTSREGHGYTARIGGYGAGVRAERRFGEHVVFEGGYLGSANQRMPAPQSPVSVFSTLHRVDASARYTHRFAAPGDPGVFAVAGLQNHSFLVQPQDLSWFYSQIYTSAALGGGAEGRAGAWALRGEARWLGPVLASERYGNGGAGGDGQRNASTGYALRAEARYETSRGGALGVAWSGSFFDTQYSGRGRRGPHEISGARVRDAFQTLSLSFSRGF